jgi:hypothetical protein
MQEKSTQADEAWIRRLTSEESIHATRNAFRRVFFGHLDERSKTSECVSVQAKRDLECRNKTNTVSSPLVSVSIRLTLAVCAMMNGRVRCGSC